MFEKHFGLSENPFLSGPQPKYLYQSLGLQEAVAHLRHAVRNREPFVVLITGDHGVGKTIVVYEALGEWGSQAKIAMITNPALTRDELVHEIGMRLGIDGAGPIHTVAELEMQLAEVRATGGTSFLVVDEAQHLDVGLLAELTALTDLQADGESLLHIIMIGQPALELLLARPDLKTLADRVGPRYLVEPLGAAETTQYLHHRITVAGGNPQAIFPADTCAKLFQVSRGVPSEINALAGRALHQAFAAGASSVSPEHVPVPEPAAPVAEAVNARESAASLSVSATSLSTEGGIDMARALSPSLFANDPAPAEDEASEPANGGEAERILPSWFDDIIAKRKATEEKPPEPVATPEQVVASQLGPTAETAMASRPMLEPEPVMATNPMPAPELAEAPAAPVGQFTPLEPFAPTPADEPVHSGSIPPPILVMPRSTPEASMPPVETEMPAEPLVFESVEPTISDEILIPPVEGVASPVQNGHSDVFDVIETESPEVPAELLESLQSDGSAEESQEAELALVSSAADPELAPIDFVERRDDYPSEARPKPMANPGWPVAAALVACVLICAVLIIKLLPATLHPTTKTPTPIATPQVTQVPATDQATAPTPHDNSATVKSGTKTVTKQPAKTGSVAEGAKSTQKPTTTTKKTVAAVPPTATPKPASAKAVAKAEPDAASTPAKAVKKVASEATSTPARTEPQRTAPKPAPANIQNYCISVGTYLFEDRANDRMTKLSDTSGLPARIVTYAEDGGTSYRVVLGSFSSRAAAEKKADELIERGLVQEARVIESESKP